MIYSALSSLPLGGGWVVVGAGRSEIVGATAEEKKVDYIQTFVMNLWL